jgi:hypothetical protein
VPAQIRTHLKHPFGRVLDPVIAGPDPLRITGETANLTGEPGVRFR